MNDLLIPSQTEAEGIGMWKLVLQTAVVYGLEFSLKKCHFLMREIEFRLVIELSMIFYTHS